MKFAEFSTTEIVKLTVKLMEVKIDKYTISRDSMNKISEILSLEEKDAEQLIAIRNWLTKIFSEVSAEAREDNDWELFDKIRLYANGITAVIDSKLFEMDALY